jgi:hypothetical protein
MHVSVHDRHITRARAEAPPPRAALWVTYNEQLHSALRNEYYNAFFSDRTHDTPFSGIISCIQKELVSKLKLAALAFSMKDESGCKTNSLFIHGYISKWTDTHTHTHTHTHNHTDSCTYNETSILLLALLSNAQLIVGCMAFIFKILTNISIGWIPDNWIFALEYADLLVPTTAFILCVEGLFLIFLSIEQCKVWCKAYHLHVVELVADFADCANSFWVKNSTWLPFSIIVSELEFRVMHCIFCDNYGIQKDAFKFDEYVQVVFEKLLVNVINIKPLDWVIVVVLTLVNWIRETLGE